MLNSQKVRNLAPEMDPLRMGMGWTAEDLGKPQIMIESTYGDSHPGSAHHIMLLTFVMEWLRGMMESTILWHIVRLSQTLWKHRQMLLHLTEAFLSPAVTRQRLQCL